jgi:DNA polymerase-3 subunit beta
VKIEIQQEALQRSLGLVAAIVPAKTTMPILTCVLVEVAEGQLRLSATNLDLSVTTVTSEVEVKTEGRAAVPAAKFASFIRSLSPGLVRMEQKGGRILVTAGKASLEEPGMNVDEFPSLPVLVEKQGLEVPTATLATMVKETSYSVSRDETRPALMGVLWELRPDGLGMVATDAHRLARAWRAFGWKNTAERDLIVDTQGLQHLSRLAEGEETAVIYLGDNQISFRIGATVLHARLLEGPFPDYQAVIPQNNDKVLLIDRDLFSQAIRRVSITADRMTSQIRLGIEGERMELSATGTDGSRAEDEIPISFEDAEPLEIGFNFSYLQDILRSIDHETVRMSLRDAQSAALIQPAEEEEGREQLCLLMPLRLTGE